MVVSIQVVDPHDHVADRASQEKMVPNVASPRSKFKTGCTVSTECVSLLHHCQVKNIIGLGTVCTMNQVTMLPWAGPLLKTNQHVRLWRKCYRWGLNRQGGSCLECFLGEFLSKSNSIHLFSSDLIFYHSWSLFLDGFSWQFNENSLMKHLLRTRHCVKPFTDITSIISYISPVNWVTQFSF